MGNRRFLTDVLLVANVAVAVLGFLASLRTSGGSDALRGALMSADANVLRRFGLIPYEVRNGQYYRLFTSMFIHSGIMHLLCNMYALYAYGRIAEGTLGWMKMGVIYLISGLCGGILVMVIGAPNTVTVGASGAIFGLMGAVFALSLLSHSLGAIKSIGLVILVNLAVTFSNPSISVGGHIGGLAGGLALGFIFGLTVRR